MIILFLLLIHCESALFSNWQTIVNPSAKGKCRSKFIKTKASKCVSLEYLQSSSEPHCIQSEGYMYEGGCFSQCDG